MSRFKLAKKDAVSDTRTNIYDLHEKKLEYFENEKDNLNNYILELDKCTTEYSKINDYVLKNKIDQLRDKIYDIKNDNSLNEYLLDFFLIIDESKKNNQFENLNPRGNMDIFINSRVNNSKSDLYNNYIQTFNPELKQLNILKTEKIVCSNCKSDNFMFEYKSSTSVCINCGLSVNTVINDDPNPVYTENLEQVIVFNYKRNNHFQECLNQLQAKENTTIPPKIIQDLTVEFKKYNIIDHKLFTIALVKSYLKKLKYNKYYEHIPTIINLFCGVKAPKITPELEQQLKIMFDEIQTPFEKYSGIVCPERKNFLNYNYVFYKMCQLLNKDEFLNFFPLLKSREKLYEHDLIWRGICNDLRWEFIASI
jgi:hypothetical protein